MGDPLNLGTSLAFPMRPDGRGGLATVSGIEAVENDLEAIINTKKGDHVLRPALGVDPAAFRSSTPKELVTRYIREAIIDAPEDRIDPSSLVVEARNIEQAPNHLTILMTYRIRGDSTTRSYETVFELEP